LDLVAETDDQWIEATLTAGQLVVRLDPRTGANRAKVTVRDRTSGTTVAVRFLVHVLPALTPEAPTDPRLFDASAGGRQTEPVGPPKGPVATVPVPPSYAPGAGAPRLQPGRKMVVAAVALLRVAVLCVGLVVVRLVNRAPTAPPSRSALAPPSTTSRPVR
jgi:hypothetical protein